MSQAAGPLDVSAFASRIPLPFVQRAAELYERARRARADLVAVALDREDMAKELDALYGADRPVGVEKGDWLVALEEHVGLGAIFNTVLDGAYWASWVTECAPLPQEVGWPETAWPLAFPRDEMN